MKLRATFIHFSSGHFAHCLGSVPICLIESVQTWRERLEEQMIARDESGSLLAYSVKEDDIEVWEDEFP